MGSVGGRASIGQKCGEFALGGGNACTESGRRDEAPCWENYKQTGQCGLGCVHEGAKSDEVVKVKLVKAPCPLPVIPQDRRGGHKASQVRGAREEGCGGSPG